MSRLFKRRPWPLLPPQARRRFIPSAGSAGQAVTGVGAIASAEAFGTAQLNFTLFPTGVASAEAFGTLGASFQLPLSGIASGEAFGTAKLNFTLSIPAIGSGEAFGTPVVVHRITASGIVSAEAFGTPTVLPTYTITAAGIASAEAFGAAAVVQPLLPQTIAPAGIASGEAFGAATVYLAPIEEEPEPTQTSGRGAARRPWEEPSRRILDGVRLMDTRTPLRPGEAARALEEEDDEIVSACLAFLATVNDAY